MSEKSSHFASSIRIFVISIALWLAGCGTSTDKLLGRSPVVEIPRNMLVDRSSAPEKNMSTCDQVGKYLGLAKTRILAMGTRGEYAPLTLRAEGCDDENSVK